MYPEGSMSDKTDPFHLGGGLMSPIWPQLSSAPERSSSQLLSVARLPSLPSPCLLFCSALGSFLHSSVDVGLIPSSLTQARWDSPVHSPSRPTHPDQVSLGDRSTLFKLLSSCVSHAGVQRYKTTASPSLSGFPSQTPAFHISLQASHSNHLWWVHSAQVGDG